MRLSLILLALVGGPALASPAWLQKFEKASNGYIEVGHAKITLQEGKDPHVRVRELAKELFAKHPKLHELDISGYRDGDTPCFTLSLPRAQWSSYQKSPAAYPRQWSGQIFEAHESEVIEKHMVFNGNPHSAEAGLSRQDISRLVFRGPNRPFAALTFDDSPHPLYEPLLLDVLARQKVKATFFCIGRNAQMYPYFVRDMAAQGHEVANHTFHHLRLPHLSATAMNQEWKRPTASYSN